MVYSLRDFGAYTVGGRIHHVTEGAPFTVNFTRSAAYDVDPRGHYAVEHGYVQFYIPVRRNAAPPVLLVHGGGMSGSCWETTPDERPGWLHLLLDRGYEVHVLDNAERGRAGFAPGLWEGDALLRSQEEAWVLFRIGPKAGFAYRRAFDHQRFPIEAFDAATRMFVPRWLTTTSIQSQVLCAALDHLEHAIVVCHSQGGEVVFDAAHRMEHRIARIIALEPSATPTGLTLPITLCTGDFLDSADHWRARDTGWRRCAARQDNVSYIGSDDLGCGHSHMLMMDKGSDRVLEACFR